MWPFLHPPTTTPAPQTIHQGPAKWLQETRVGGTEVEWGNEYKERAVYLTVIYLLNDTVCLIQG